MIATLCAKQGSLWCLHELLHVLTEKKRWFFGNAWWAGVASGVRIGSFQVFERCFVGEGAKAKFPGLGSDDRKMSRQLWFGGYLVGCP
jgi:hypothetical protein